MSCSAASICQETSELQAQPDLSVAEVRRALATLRRNWDDMRADPGGKPMYVSDSLGFCNISIEEFALRFVLSHHSKRAKR